MRRPLFNVFLLATLAAPFSLLAACSSSSGGTGAGTTTTTATNSSGSTTTTTNGTGGGGTGGGGTGGTATGDAGDCKTACITAHPMEAQVFEGYELKECGCAASSPCIASCTAECTDPTKLTQTSACGMCLLTEAGKGLSSTCTTKAGITDCEPDPKCAPFLTCALACP